MHAARWVWMTVAVLLLGGMAVVGGATRTEAALAKPSATGEFADGTDLYAVKAKTLRGEPLDLKEVAGSYVTMVLNVASECGYTANNYDGIRQLIQQFPDLVVLALPCNGAFLPSSP